MCGSDGTNIVFHRLFFVYRGRGEIIYFYRYNGCTTECARVRVFVCLSGYYQDSGSPTICGVFIKFGQATNTYIYQATRHVASLR